MESLDFQTSELGPTLPSKSTRASFSARLLFAPCPKVEASDSPLLLRYCQPQLADLGVRSGGPHRPISTPEVLAELEILFQPTSTKVGALWVGVQSRPAPPPRQTPCSTSRARRGADERAHPRVALVPHGCLPLGPPPRSLLLPLLEAVTSQWRHFYDNLQDPCSAPRQPVCGGRRRSTRWVTRCAKVALVCSARCRGTLDSSASEANIWAWYSGGDARRGGRARLGYIWGVSAQRGISLRAQSEVRGSESLRLDPLQPASRILCCRRA